MKQKQKQKQKQKRFIFNNNNNDNDNNDNDNNDNDNDNNDNDNDVRYLTLHLSSAGPPLLPGGWYLSSPASPDLLLTGNNNINSLNTWQVIGPCYYITALSLVEMLPYVM